MEKGNQGTQGFGQHFRHLLHRGIKNKNRDFNNHGSYVAFAFMIQKIILSITHIHVL